MYGFSFPNDWYKIRQMMEERRRKEQVIDRKTSAWYHDTFDIDIWYLQMDCVAFVCLLCELLNVGALHKLAGVAFVVNCSDPEFWLGMASVAKCGQMWPNVAKFDQMWPSVAKCGQELSEN